MEESKIRDIAMDMYKAAEEERRIKKIYEFVKESNKIEGITRDPSKEELEITHNFLLLDRVDMEALHTFVSIFEPGARFRCKPGLNVLISTGAVINHRPIPGGPEVVAKFDQVVGEANAGAHPWIVHQAYETLHPYTDGNGRSGRMLWAWQMVKQAVSPGLALGFLHAWYYQSLEHGR